MSNLNIGDKAPDFEMPTKDGTIVKLASLQGKFVVLYFYPKDDTPGCTIEAGEFNKFKPEFEKLGGVIIGVSKDDLNSHHKFKEKYCLEFDLASDKDSDTCENYGVWGEKSMYGKTYMGINRTTFLIDKEGTIAHIWREVAVNGHAGAVLDKIKELQGK